MLNRPADSAPAALLPSAPVRRSAGLTGLWRRAAALVGLVAATAISFAQPAEPTNGPRRVDPAWHALVHATLVPSPGQEVKDATIVLRDGVIVSVQQGGPVPDGARTWDCTGLTVYSGLIDPFVVVDAPMPDSTSPGRHWNDAVTPQRSALDGQGLAESARKDLRAQGFAVAAIAPKGPVFAGSGAVVSLAERGDRSAELARVLVPKAFHAVQIESLIGPDTGYPSSKMGAIALVRQTLADVPWYQAALAAHQRDPAQFDRPAPNDAAVALAVQAPLFFDVRDELDVLRAGAIATEFKRPMVAVGCGTEFRRLEAIATQRTPLILPLAFAEKPKVSTAAEREALSLSDLLTWEASPTNPVRLDNAGPLVALTTSKLPKEQKFFDNLREAIRAGLSEQRALAMLTVNPAEILGLTRTHGTVEPGKAANLVVVKGSLFAKDRIVRDVWIDGVRHEVTAAPKADLEGQWTASFDMLAGPLAGTITVSDKNELTFEREPTVNDEARQAARKAKADAERQAKGEKDEAGDKPKDEADKGDEKADEANAKPKPKKFKARSVTLNERRLDFILDAEALDLDGDGAVLVSATAGETVSGTATLPDGSRTGWTASRVPAAGGADDAKDASDDKPDPDRYAGLPEAFGYPFGTFSVTQAPALRDIWIENATIWTSGPQGIVEGGTLFISGGKVHGVYAKGEVPRVAIASGALKIDAKGKHITPGIIDCHSHTGISGGVNEGTQACTAEVRIGDVIDPDSVSWYRQLGGGITAVSQLHGSANPIGGQNSVVKPRWGVAHPDQMRFENAKPGIKFALGENVKQSNWGERNNWRYPQTRMGVETFIRDRFTAAREYRAATDRWKALSDSEKAQGVPPRTDYELEALGEILAGERLVHCHSYRQDEILMLCRVAKDFGFKIGTFQHVLEGYKVAEAIREQAIGASAFSDWWAFKFEAFDAIPSAGAIMHDAGVNVSFNSDSDEMARRMNIEAAKAVKYGGVDPAEALKFVTLNPAKQLMIDARVGSLEKGKDGDFVIWSGSPLSTYSRCERTFIEGIEFFSLEADAAHRLKTASERSRILQKLTKKPSEKPDSEGAKGKGPAPAGLTSAEGDGATGFDEFRSAGAGARRGAGLAPVGDSIEEARLLAFKRSLEAQFRWMIENGIDPTRCLKGDCGCSDTHWFQRN